MLISSWEKKFPASRCRNPRGSEDCMEPPKVKTATSADRASAVDTVVLAFAADPMARWCWPDARQYLTGMPNFTMAFGGAAFTRDSAFCTENYAGAALWLPPVNIRMRTRSGRSWSRPSRRRFVATF